jgi:UDP-N-acetylmuramyl pentapeptide phosphotransferase/UDP-N-acetylglucosamine-1-phosphate transferase
MVHTCMQAAVVYVFKSNLTGLVDGVDALAICGCSSRVFVLSMWLLLTTCSNVRLLGCNIYQDMHYKKVRHAYI